MVDILDPVMQRLIAEYKKYEVPIVLAPSQWKNCPSSRSYSWQTVPYSRAGAMMVPKDKTGVYTFIVRPKVAGHEASYILYVGKSERQPLRTRFRQYFREHNDPKGRPLVRWMLDRWKKHIEFCFAIVPSSDVDAAENDLLNALVPPYNEMFEGSIRPAVKAFRR